MSMRTLVIDFDCSFASTIGRVLQHEGCQVQAASSATQALSLLRQNRFDLILADSYGPVGASEAIVREIYTRVPTKVYVMTDTSALEMAPETRREERMDIVPATAESVLSIVRETGDSDVALVIGFRAPAGLPRTLSEEGYPAVVTHDITGAVRLFFAGTYPVVFLQASVPSLVNPDEFAVLHLLTARSLAVLAHAQPASDLRCGLKPHKIADVRRILEEVKPDSGKPERAMSVAL